MSINSKKRRDEKKKNRPILTAYFWLRKNVINPPGAKLIRRAYKNHHRTKSRTSPYKIAAEWLHNLVHK